MAAIRSLYIIETELELRFQHSRSIIVIHRQFTTASAFVVTAVLLALLFFHVEFSDLAATLKNIEPGYVLLGLTAYSSSYLFRALRFHVLLNKEVGVVDLFAVVCIHNMANGIMPARSGELSYIYLLKKVHNKSAGDSTATLMLARIMDLISISILFFASVMLVKELPNLISDLLSAIAFSAVLVILFFIVLVQGGRTFVESMERLAVRLDLVKIKLICCSINGMKEAESRIDAVKIKTTLILSFQLSLLIWISLYLMYYILMRGLGLELSITLIILGTTFAIFTNIVPVPSIGSFGVYEGLWTISFVALGFPKETAIATGLAIHIISIVYFIFLGLLGLSQIKTSIFHVGND